VSETLPWPEWLAGAVTSQERLQKILAAVHRCYMEHDDPAQVPTGPHMTISMAENFIRQMLP
jgi:acetone carboxylase gamma subunit